MKKILLLVLIFVCFNALQAADTNWRLHPVFDEEVTHVVETPEYVYFTSRQMEQNPDHDVYLSLFRYDKKGEELLSLSGANILSGNNIRDIIYNPGKGYLAVLYKDFDLDLLFNNGNVVNIPYYRQASMTSSKDVNSLSIDIKNHRLYLATDFGYVAVNDKKNEIAESRIYGEPFKAFCRVGDKYLVIKDNDLLSVDATSSRLTLADYDKIASYDTPLSLYPLSDNFVLLIGGPNNNQYIKKLHFEETGLREESMAAGKIYNIENNPIGVTVTNGNTIFQFKTDGTHDQLDRPASFANSAAATLNMSEIWNGMKRKGLSSVKKTGDQWNITRDWMLPNSPATYISRSFVNHPTKGFMMLNYGSDATTMSLYTFDILQLSAYKNNRWTNYAPVYTNPERASLLTCTNGIAIEPDNSNYIYISSFHTGIARLNLSDPKDIIHLGYGKDPDLGKEGFVLFDQVPVNSQSWSNMTAPMFDKQGNLWVSFENWDNQSDPKAHYYCWLAEDRKATTSASNLIQPKRIELEFYRPLDNYALAIPLLKTGNGIILHSALVNSRSFLALYNTNGTPTNTSDDTQYVFEEFMDTDGNSLTMGRIRCLWEDPNTGYVWVGHANGVCYFSPKNVMNGDFEFNKAKVSRNDGTNLADYLLEGVSVNQITADAEGRKWFATNGAGVVCTSSDGRQILEEFNTSNSMLPDDVVYGIGYNAENNSLMFSTDQGYAEYFLPASQETSSKTDVKAYPNPVRPEYSGYVTITDIPQRSFVKITDVKGNLVKDLGIMSGFEMLWDISDTNFNRVKSGVYYIMVSPSDESSSYSAVGKILVVN